MLKPPTDLRNHVFSALSTGIIERDPFLVERTFK
jgi:hypothetical protein